MAVSCSCLIVIPSAGSERVQTAGNISNLRWPRLPPWKLMPASSHSLCNFHAPLTGHRCFGKLNSLPTFLLRCGHSIPNILTQRTHQKHLTASSTKSFRQLVSHIKGGHSSEIQSCHLRLRGTEHHKTLQPDDQAAPQEPDLGRSATCACRWLVPVYLRPHSPQRKTANCQQLAASCPCNFKPSLLCHCRHCASRRDQHHCQTHQLPGHLALQPH